MSPLALLLALAFLLAGLPAAAADPPEEAPPAAARHAGALLRVIGFLPSRALDLLDPLRARVRLGPGMAVSLRATEAGDLFAGSYSALYAGLPGPRGRFLPRLPLGVESRAGAEVAVADASTGAGLAPRYSATEFGAGLQLFFFGFDVGLDPLEFADLAGGFVGLDPSGDDLR